jgi:hypothetical protein
MKSIISCEHFITHNTKTPQQPNISNKLDAVLYYITTIPSINSLLLTSYQDFLPNNFDMIEIENDIYITLVELKYNDGKVDHIKFNITSKEHDIQYIQTFIDKCNREYERTMLNKLGNSTYFFDMQVQSKDKRSVQNQQLPRSHLIYSKHKYQTTRTFDNVFFEQRQIVKNRVDFFLKQREWYVKKGIPYTLGFLFHGLPGCGKTSTIKAISSATKRHIVNIHLNEIKTKAQLQHLFFNDEITVFNGQSSERYVIPTDQRLYVIEDIDSMGDTVLRREWKEPAPKIVHQTETWLDGTPREEKDDKEVIDLSFILNLLDGTLESDGRIIIITTNFPERIDKALIRPGRIDAIVKFEKCSDVILNEMITSFYDEPLEIPITGKSGKWTPAEVNQIMFRNFNNKQNAIREINDLDSESLYGFDIMDRN